MPLFRVTKRDVTRKKQSPKIPSMIPFIINFETFQKLKINFVFDILKKIIFDKIILSYNKF